jgi:hypothetical protein
MGDPGNNLLGFFRENVAKWRGYDTAGDGKTEKNQDHCKKNGDDPEKIGEYHPVPGISLGDEVHDDGIEEGEAPVDSEAQDHDIDEKGDNDMFFLINRKARNG